MSNEAPDSILGVGVDIVDIARCVEKLNQRPQLADAVCAPGRRHQRALLLSHGAGR